jgi:hypothetical protein
MLAGRALLAGEPMSRDEGAGMRSVPLELNGLARAVAVAMTSATAVPARMLK